MKILQINSVYKNGSTGKIVYDIHTGLTSKNIESIVCFGRGNNINEKIVAVLHDTLEDTKITKDDLINYGFNKEIIDAIITITKKADEDYNDYISRIKLNNLAKTVKIADILDNLNFSRLKEINSDDIKRNIKYLNTLNKLLY